MTALLSPLCLLAQERQKPWDNIEFYPPSAASLIKALDCPPAHYTGNPGITVPLYTVESSELQFPISLGFNINAYRMASSAPETVGAGWSLNADLLITRVINGTDDIKSTYKSRPGFLKDYTNASSVTKAMYAMGILDGTYDTEPDKFYYRLPDKSGHFYFSPDGTVVPVPYNGIKIVHTNGTFTITDTDGSTYTFDKTDLSTNLSASGNNSYTSAWHCSKIVSASRRDSIEFVYNTSRTYQTKGSHTYIEVYDKTASYPTEVGNNPYFKSGTLEQLKNGSIPFEQIAGPKMRRIQNKAYITEIFRKPNRWEQISNKNQSDPALVEIEINPAQLTEIRWKGGTVKFTYGNNYEYVTSMSVANKVSPSKSIVNVAFTQTGTGAKRVLTKLKINNDQYAFSYPNQSRFPYGEGINDFWGSEAYGSLTQMGPIPTYDVPVEVGYKYAVDGVAPDELKSAVASVGNETSSMLTKYLNEMPQLYFSIRYPNGGKTEYYMQHHQTGTYSTGGLRLAKVRYLDSQNGIETVKREKRYEYAGSRADAIPTFGSLDRSNCCTEQEIIYCLKSMSDAETVGTARKRVFYPHTTGLSSFSGSSPVVYSTVTEYDVDTSSAQERIIAKTINRFSLGTYKLSGGPSLPYPLQPIDLTEGQLRGTETYRCNDDGSFSLVHSIDYTYSTYQPAEYNKKIYRMRLWPRKYPVEITGLKLDNMYRYNNTSLAEDTQYIPVGCSRKTKEVEKTYADDGTPLVRTTEYYYDNASTYHMPTRAATVMSDGTSMVEYTLRPCDYSAGHPALTRLRYMNIIDVPVEQVTVSNGAITRGELYEYDFNGSVVEVYNHETEVQDTRSPMNYVYQKFFTAYPGTPRYLHYCTMRYDANNKLASVAPYSLPVTTYLWGYGGLYPVAKVVNGSSTFFETALGQTLMNQITSSSNFTDAQKLSIDNLRSRYTDCLITTAQYEPLVGIRKLTDPSGHTTTYDYHTTSGNLGKLQYIKDSKNRTMTEYEYSNQ